jgi:hypothetical protein
MITAAKILEEITRQDMVTAIPNEEGGHIFVWAANTEEQLDALIACDTDLMHKMLEMKSGCIVQNAITITELRNKLELAYKHSSETEIVLIRKYNGLKLANLWTRIKWVFTGVR